ncbi:DUF803 domain membrane protein [Mycena chlorophos]|uniref:DUF803 domain membrane protein n=1 Tax=Mycena chlorophos TaxID=658473 RepID=A0A8H6TD78_MYCCL|nr:DUF803 domain membrane protein [Mycena chlorophos]
MVQPAGIHLGGDKLPELTTGTVIGISVAITGNVLISLALNLQKLSHIRREAERVRLRQRAHDASPSSGASSNNSQQDGPVPAVLAVQHNIGYGSANGTKPRQPLVSRLFRFKRSQDASERTTLLPVDVIAEEDAPRSQQSSPTDDEEEDDFEGGESAYLKSKLWWFGFCLMNVGEIGNFISYAWAPASVVAPLGTFALMANCVFAPLMLGERFRKRDVFGILVAVIGAVTVVLASNASDVRLDPDALVAAISELPFKIYTGIYLFGIVVLSILSEQKIGRQVVFVDVGLCALFGGFTVLSTKAVSTLLTMQWFEMFTKWITYPTLAVLLLTGLGQIRYLNRALMRFDGKVVIPIQFVLFTISAILGSAVLYGDFKKATFHQLVTFLYGCAATFAGVFIIAWEPERAPAQDELGSPVDEEQNADDSEPEDEPPQPGASNRKKRATLILPNGLIEHELLHKPSAVNILNLSPARPLLMVHTPPRELSDRLRDVERDPLSSTPTVGSQRRRAISHLGGERNASQSHFQPGRNHSLVRGAGGTWGRNSITDSRINPWATPSDSLPSSPEEQR